MGLQIDVGDQDSTIVITVSGGTDVAAPEPIRDALFAAAQEGRTVVLDLSQLVDLDAEGLRQFLNRIEAIGDRIRLVADRPDIRRLLAQADPGSTGIHATVAAAVEAETQPSTAKDRTDANGHDHGPSRELQAMFADLEDQYRQAIERCRELLETAEHQQPFRAALAGTRSESTGPEESAGIQTRTAGTWNDRDGGG